MVGGEADLSPPDLVTVLFFLAHDQDGAVRDGARMRLAELPEGMLREAVSTPSLHPRILDGLARLHYRNGEMAVLIVSHINCSEETRIFLAEHGIEGAPRPHHAATQPHRNEEPGTDEELTEEGEEPVDEESEAFRGKYQLAQVMGVSDKIKIAQTGDKEWRMILIRDSNKLVSGTVIKNPRITEQEVLVIAKSSIQNDEILRVICANKEWIKNYQIRKALVENNKTPLPTALRFLATLGEKDLAHLAKSKSISSVLSTQARKLLLSKKKDR
ncbi:hypothetical protein [Geobacter sp.]|uniref:hypothetical protein n=1 Tax=Geobacter sp. TaxID=46610 RepID=UPI0027B90F40|nr:hypothetical protein [Geobacter sp.]